MITLVIAICGLFFCCVSGMQESSVASKWATQELHKRLSATYDRWTLSNPEQRDQFCNAHEKALLPMIWHLVAMGGNPHFAPLIKVHSVKQHYIKNKNALEMARELNFHEIAKLLEAIPKHIEKIQ